MYVGIHVALVHIILFSTRWLFQTKEIGNRYKSISAEEKAKWQSKADAAKEAYKKDLAEYEKKAAKKPKAEPESKKKKPNPASDSSADSDDSESDADDSDDSDGDSDWSCMEQSIWAVISIW